MSIDLYQLPPNYRPKYYTANGLTLSNGNTKLGPDTLVINMTSATDCPSRRLGLCQLSNPADCYALKAERLYKECLPYRRRQADYYQNTTINRVIGDINAIIDQANRSKHVKAVGGIRYIRFSESGDFTNQNKIRKLDLIALAIKYHHPEVQFYGYSARSDLDFSRSPHLIVRGSGHDNGNAGRVIVRTLTADQKAQRTIIIDGTEYLICPGRCFGCTICKSHDTAQRPLLIPKH